MSSLSQVKKQRGRKKRLEDTLSNTTRLARLLEDEKPDSMFGTPIYGEKSTSGLTYYVSLDEQQIKHDPALAVKMGGRKKAGGTQFDPTNGERRMQEHKERIAPAVCEKVKFLVEHSDPSIDLSLPQLLGECPITETEMGFISFEIHSNKVYVSYHCWPIE